MERMAGAEKHRSTEQRNTVTMGVAETADSTFEWRGIGAQVTAIVHASLQPTDRTLPPTTAGQRPRGEASRACLALIGEKFVLDLCTEYYVQFQ